MGRTDSSPSVMPRSRRDGRFHPATSLWRDVETHHENFVVGLFVVPVALVAFLFAEAAYTLSRLAS